MYVIEFLRNRVPLLNAANLNREYTKKTIAFKSTQKTHISECYSLYFPENFYNLLRSFSIPQVPSAKEYWDIYSP